MQYDTASRQVILSGCSGGGKSTLLAELARRGFETVEEPGRRIVAEELQGGGSALPWVDPEAFARRAVAMAAEDRTFVNGAKDWVFFDRGLFDAAVALEHATGTNAADILDKAARFHRQVFLTPPWPEIYRTDGARRHDMGQAIEEYHRLHVAFERWGYNTVILPKVEVGERADFILDRLSGR